MRHWQPYELHTHTFHSDGKQSLLELAEAAKSLGFAGFALTDHNTMTGLSEQVQVQERIGIDIIQGLEWTTFFGHMVTLGIRDYVDWRQLSPFHISRGIDGVHRQGGVVGIAHPFRVGSPMCTGCFWEFEISDWGEVDYIEVWSGLFPSIQKNNIRAFALWTDLLNRGIKISATSGRDWHIKDPVKEPVCATYLQMDPDEGTEFGVINAVRNGEIAVSMGPLPFLSIRTLEGHVIAGIGGSISTKAHASNRFEVSIGVDFTARSGQWEIVDTSITLRLNSNKGEIAVCELSMVDQERILSLDLDGIRWLRAEMFGTFHQVHTMIGFTNPIYFND
jgi:hypothetical protein